MPDIRNYYIVISNIFYTTNKTIEFGVLMVNKYVFN